MEYFEVGCLTPAGGWWCVRRFKEVEEEAGDVGDGSSDDGAIVRDATPEVELGPPLELSAPFVPRPATESLWLIRVRWAAGRNT